MKTSVCNFLPLPRQLLERARLQKRLIRRDISISTFNIRKVTKIISLWEINILYATISYWFFHKGLLLMKVIWHASTRLETEYNWRPRSDDIDENKIINYDIQKVGIHIHYQLRTKENRSSYEYNGCVIIVQHIAKLEVL